MYNKTFWKDHVTEHPDRYKHITNPDGSVEQILFHGTVQQEGTNQDALHFNNIETGLQHTNIASCYGVCEYASLWGSLSKGLLLPSATGCLVAVRRVNERDKNTSYGNMDTRNKRRGYRSLGG